jgi:metal transporter CNNM
LQALFRRAQLKALVGLHSSAEGLGGNLSADEISIITGALDLTSKTAWTAMTPLDKVSMGLSFEFLGP